MSREYSKKFIKRLFRKPWKVKCPKCKNQLFELPKDEFPDKILFRCVSKDCGHIIDVTEYKEVKVKMDRHHPNKKNRKSRAIVPFDVKRLVELTRVLTHYRIQDKWYIIDNETTYNPIQKIKYKDRVQTNVSDDIHKELLEIVITNIKNATKQ